MSVRHETRHQQVNLHGKKIFGTIGDDDILGSDNNDMILGFRGDDTIFAALAMTPFMAPPATI
ncbi:MULTISPECIES: hypothetical protein [unclassified Bradyrhizobium]|uniref:hypothetical protein n=1 Tax=unclassified Bradyrhizobium TaxID=2631580 RepID=UPI00143CD3EF|nr:MULTISPECIES: hypothetical protein [unclassified Bradyrhizobium]